MDLDTINLLFENVKYLDDIKFYRDILTLMVKRQSECLAKDNPLERLRKEVFEL